MQQFSPLRVHCFRSSPSTLSQCNAFVRRGQFQSLATGGVQCRMISWWGKKKDKKEMIETTMAPPDPDLGFLEDRVERSEDEIEALRNKSGLPDYLRAEMLGEGMEPFQHVWQYDKEHVRKNYAIFGRASGLKPGVAWPRREELEYIKGYEKVFYPPLEKLKAAHDAKKFDEDEDRRKRETLIMQNLAKLPAWKAEFFEKYMERRKLQDEELKAKQKLLDEVREYLGYSVQLNDPRFQEALLRREEEKAASAQKGMSKKKREQQKILEELAALAAEEMRRAEEEKQAAKSEQASKPASGQSAAAVEENADKTKTE